MAKPKWYSPQLSREVVSQLYHRAKARDIPMTKLANQIIEKALGKNKQIKTNRVIENRNITEPN